jgi:hypothetical protein
VDLPDGRVLEALSAGPSRRGGCWCSRPGHRRPRSGIRHWQRSPPGADSRREDVAAALGGLVSEVDQAALTGEFADYIASSFRRAVSTGIAGWRDDDMSVSQWIIPCGRTPDATECLAV